MDTNLATELSIQNILTSSFFSILFILIEKWKSDGVQKNMNL